MSESLHADLLAQWLSAAPGSVPPEGLEEEVLGSIYALAPDRAPPHRVRIEDVLDALLTGPVADPEVSEAAIALNPDLAPAHRVDIDQILDSVTEGPFAAGAQPGGEIIDLAAARRRRRWWVGTGAIAAAAVALFIVVPISHKAEEAPTGMSAKEAKPERARSAPSAKKQARKAKRSKRAKPEARMRRAEESAPVEAPAVADRKDEGKRAAVGSTAGTGSGSFGAGGLAGLTEPDASPAPSAPFPPGMGRMGSRAQSISAGSAPALEKKSRDQPPRPADLDDAEERAEYEEDAASVEIAAESSASADIAPEKAKQRKKKAKPKKPMPSALPSRELEGNGEGLGPAVPKGTWDGYPETQAFSDAVVSAVRAAERDLAGALTKIRDALRRYKKVHPLQRALAHRQEARILDRLGRHAEAKEAKKKAREIESAN
jgi:hypothetical protein